MPRKDNEVLKNILNRKKSGARKGKIGLIIQGGGMRGAFAGGVMMKLEELGLQDTFDYIYSSSSGALAAVYLLSEKTKEGTSIYWENLSGHRFIQPWKIWKVMNLDYLIDKIVGKTKPLNIKKIVGAKTILKIFVAEPKSGNLHFVTNKDGQDLLQVLKCTCSFPGCYYPLIKLDGKKYLDGNSIKVFTLEEAIQDNCTDLLVITTVHEDYLDKYKKGLVNYLLYDLFLFPLGRKFKERFRKRIESYNQELDIIFGRKPLEKINIYSISPDYMIGNSETSAETLRQFAEHGFIKTDEAFSQVLHKIQK